MGTSISLIICNVLLINIYYYRSIKLDVIKFWKSIIKQSIPFTIPIIVVILLMNLINISGVVKLVLFGGLYTMLYCVTAYFISMNEYEKNIIKKILVRIHLMKV